MAQKILIDTDPGQDIDDLLAIWFALLRPELQIVGITTVVWPTGRRARLVKRLLRYLDRLDIPVGVGADDPRRSFTPEEQTKWRNFAAAMNHACFAEPPDPLDNPANLMAVDLILRTIREHPGEVILACIAPPTNIAAALTADPGIIPLVKSISLMGGEIALDRSEHNIAFDHDSSRVVLESGIPITMGTWSVTRQLVLDDADCARIRERGTPLCIAMAEAIKAWHPVQSWKPGPVMYDLFPIVHSYDSAFYGTEEMRVRVETEGENKGKTLLSDDGRLINVTTAIEAEALHRIYMETILT